NIHSRPLGINRTCTLLFRHYSRCCYFGQCHRRRVLPGRSTGLLPPIESARRSKSHLASKISRDLDTMGSRLGHQSTPKGITVSLKKTLEGKPILVLRAPHQALETRKRLEELGASVLCEPVFDILPPLDWTVVDVAIASLETWDWVVFSSQNGVGFFL